LFKRFTFSVHKAA